MTAGPVVSGGPPAVPRPGIAKTLGILNIIFAVVMAGYALWSGMITLAMVTAEKPTAAATGPGTKADTVLAAMTEPAVVRFGVIDLVTAIPLQILMFATGI